MEFEDKVYARSRLNDASDACLAVQEESAFSTGRCCDHSLAQSSYPAWWMCELRTGGQEAVMFLAAGRRKQLVRWHEGGGSVQRQLHAKAMWQTVTLSVLVSQS